MNCVLCQWAGSQPTSLMVESNGNWGLVRSGQGCWGPPDWDDPIHLWINMAHEIGFDVAVYLVNDHESHEWAIYQYEVATGGVLYDPETDTSFYDDGPAIVYVHDDRPSCANGHVVPVPVLDR